VTSRLAKDKTNPRPFPHKVSIALRPERVTVIHAMQASPESRIFFGRRVASREAVPQTVLKPLHLGKWPARFNSCDSWKNKSRPSCPAHDASHPRNPRTAMGSRREAPRGLDLASAHKERTRRTVNLEETAQEGHQDEQGSAIRSVHTTAHVPDAIRRLRL
jgi:hypothetical protein